MADPGQAKSRAFSHMNLLNKRKRLASLNIMNYFFESGSEMPYNWFVLVG